MTNQQNGARPRSQSQSSQCPTLPSPTQLRAMVDIEMQYTFNMWPELREGKVLTREFLHCCNLVVRFIDSLGLAFTPVSRDVHGNTRTVMTRYMQDRERFLYIEDMLDYDLSMNNKTTAEALLWLKRGLNFLCTFLQSFVEDYDAGIKTESISSNLRTSYEGTLAMYHGYVLKKLFTVLCAASPQRTQLVQRLCVIVDEHDPEVFFARLKVFYQGLRSNLDTLFAFYTARNLFQES